MSENIKKDNKFIMNEYLEVNVKQDLVQLCSDCYHVFAITASTPMILLCIILAIPGFSLWGLAYFNYKKILTKSTQKVNPIIDKNYDVIYEACEKANQLLG
jgi:hypothetical protein